MTALLISSNLLDLADAPTVLATPQKAIKALQSINVSISVQSTSNEDLRVRTTRNIEPHLPSALPLISMHPSEPAAALAEPVVKRAATKRAARPLVEKCSIRRKLDSSVIPTDPRAAAVPSDHHLDSFVPSKVYSTNQSGTLLSLSLSVDIKAQVNVVVMNSLLIRSEN